MNLIINFMENIKGLCMGILFKMKSRDFEGYLNKDRCYL